MVIYNVTTNVEEAEVEKWLRFMREEYLPKMLSTGKFIKVILTRVEVKEPLGGITYSTQYYVRDKVTLKAYYAEDAPELKKEHNRLFGGKTVAFQTELRVIEELYKADKNE